MKSFGSKCMAYIGNEPALKRQIRLFRQVFPQCDIIVVVGFQADRIMAEIEGVRFIENPDIENTNVTRSFGLGLRAVLTKKVFLTYGDLAFNKETITVQTDESALFVDGTNTFLESKVGLTIAQSYVTHLDYEIGPKWAQMAFLKSKELDLYRKLAFNRDNGRLLAYEGLNYVIDNGGTFKAMVPKDMNVIEINTLEDIQHANETLSY